MADVQKILKSHSSSTPSRWRENAEWRKENREWLKKSQQIAMTVLDCMDKMGITQKELATKMNVSPQYISKLLKGCENLSLETISNIEKILGIKILVIQNFNTVPYETLVNQWQSPEFKNLKQAKEINQQYDSQTMEFLNIKTKKNANCAIVNYSA